MKYSYSVLPVIDERGRIQIIKRPLVDIEVFGPKGVARVLAHIDSGADRSLFHIDIARKAGLDLTKASRSRMIGIVGGTEVLILEEVEMRVALSSNHSAVVASGITLQGASEKVPEKDKRQVELKTGTSRSVGLTLWQNGRKKP